MEERNKTPFEDQKGEKTLLESEKNNFSGEEFQPSPEEGGKGKSSLKGFLIFVITLLVLKLFFVDAYNIPSSSMEPTLIQGDFILTNKLVYEISNPRRGDIVVFIFPKPEEFFHRRLVTTPILREFANITFIKRVIGKPGDVISFHNGKLSINGKPLTYKLVKETSNYYVYEEIIPRDKGGPVRHLVQYSKHPSRAAFIGRFGVLKDQIPPSACLGVNPQYPFICSKIRVPKGYYFVMGDNRDNSEDGRYWGFVPRDMILSTPFMIFFSGEVPHLSPSDSTPLSGLTQLFHALLHPYWSRIGRPLIY